MGMLRMIVAYGLAAISAASIAWCTFIAEPVDAPMPGADFEVTRALPAPAVTPDRDVTTDVTIARATPADLRHVPEPRIDERQRQVRVTIVHQIRMDADDQLAGWIRHGSDFPAGIQTVTDDGLGAIKVGGTWLAPTVRLAPVLTTTAGKTTAEFRVIVLRQVRGDGELTLDFLRPTARPPVALRRTVTLFPTEWTVLRSAGIEPDREEAERLQFTVEYPVSVTLVQDSQGFADQEPTRNFSWETALAIITTIVLVAFLLRSLGLSWWQRLPNRELAVGLLLAAPAVVIPIFAQHLQPIAYVIMFAALPALALRHATRTVPTAAPWTIRDALAVTALAVLVALGMLAWSGLHYQLAYADLVTGAAVAALAAAGSAVAFSADLGIRVVVVRLAAVAAGTAVGALALALWTKALLTGVYPPDSVRLVLGVCWSLIPISAVAVATRHWSRAAVASALIASLLVQGWPSEWLDAGSWSVAEPTHPDATLGLLPLSPLLRGALGLLLLGFVLLVLRLRRLGGTLTAVHNRVAASTVTVCLMVLYLTPRGTSSLPDLDVIVPLLSITSIVAWITAWWLLGNPHPDLIEPATPEQHRELVRAALHQRLLLVAEQELYRVGRGRISAGELTMADFNQQRGELETALRDHGRRPETAFATAAACTPWHNGVHAFTVCLLLSLPFTILYGLPAGPDLSSYIFDARYLLTLPAFGFLFGYFYPRIRGTQPMTKALHLMVAALLTELSAYLPAVVEPDVSALDKVQLVAIVIGQVVLMYIGLGLYWEWRIMHLAGEPWGRVRNVRSVRSLATPLLAVLIAAITTAATSAAGQTVDRLLKGDQVTSEQR